MENKETDVVVDIIEPVTVDIAPNVDTPTVEVNQVVANTTPQMTVMSPANLLKKKNSKIVLAFALGILIVLGAAAFVKGYIIAATVNGSPISRIAVVRELEKSGGKAALDALIQQKLIKAELEKAGIKVDSTKVAEKMKEIEDKVVAQGGTLDEALASQSLTRAQLEEQVGTQVQLETLLADKITVSQEEIDTFITQNDIKPTEQMPADNIQKLVEEQLKSQKFQEAVGAWVTEITTAANIKRYTSY